MRSKAIGSLGGLLILLLLYVGAYVSLSDPTTLQLKTSSIHGPTIEKVILVPNYRVGGQLSHTLFQPLKVVDQRVRPGYWMQEIKR